MIVSNEEQSTLVSRWRGRSSLAQPLHLANTERACLPGSMFVLKLEEGQKGFRQKNILCPNSAASFEPWRIPHDQIFEKASSERTPGRTGFKNELAFKRPAQETLLCSACPFLFSESSRLSFDCDQQFLNFDSHSFFLLPPFPPLGIPSHRPDGTHLKSSK